MTLTCLYDYDSRSEESDEASHPRHSKAESLEQRDAYGKKSSVLKIALLLPVIYKSCSLCCKIDGWPQQEARLVDHQAKENHEDDSAKPDKELCKRSSVWLHND